MIWLLAIALGVVQGLTEFLPISSSGHLVLARHWFGLTDAGVAFDVLLHLGTLLAIAIVYRKDLTALVASAARLPMGRSTRAERAWLLCIAIGIAPVAAVGLFVEDWIDVAFTSPRIAAGMLLLTAVFLFASHAFRRASGRVTPVRAFVVGLFQILTILPGVSRSGTTIAAGMMAGVEPREAARFSFLMAAPLFLAAAIFKLPDLFAAEGPIPAGPMAVAFVASFVSGYVAIRWLLAVLAKGRFIWFGVYCAVLGVVALVASS